MPRHDQDAKIFNAMKNAHLIKTHPGASDSQSKAAVDQALAETFDMASQPAILNKHGMEFGGIIDVLLALHPVTPWA